jgi:hypothetical protein
MKAWSWTALTRLATMSAVLVQLGCTEDPVVPPSSTPTLRLARTAEGAIKLELTGAPTAVRAVEVELVASGGEGGAVVLEDATPPPGTPLDRVRIQALGTNRAILFAGDTRGVRLAGTGEVARLRARLASGGAAEGTLSIERAVVVGVEGQRVDVTLGGALPLR